MQRITILADLIIIVFFLTTYVTAQDGGPYTVDENTLLLMHLDSDLTTVGTYSGNVTNWGNDPVYDTSKEGLGNCYRINNTYGLQCILLDVSPELDMGNNWTVEFWVKVGNFGNGAAEYPTIFIKDGFGMTAVNIGFRNDGKGFTSEVTFDDQSQIRIEQTNGINLELWHHIALVSNAEERKISLIIHDEDWFTIFSESRSFPQSTDGTLCTADRQMFLGGVDGSSNIQFDGWVDELRISNTARDFSPVLPELPPLQAQTENLELYSSNEDAGNWTSITESLQRECIELSSFWDRPQLTSILPEEKIKIYLLNRDDFQQYAGVRMPDWKCGWFDRETNIIVVTLPESGVQENYYGSFESLAVGALAQLLVHRKLLMRENITSSEFILEGFGLYRGGYRPNRDMILQAIDDLGRLPEKSDIENAVNFNEGYMKDLITSYVECQLFNGIVYQGLTTWMGGDLWHPYFKYYYQKDDNERIKYLSQSENFDFYGAEQDIPYLDAITNKLEEKLAHYETLYEFEINNRFNVVIFPTAQASIECMGYDDYNGGSGCGGDKLDILSPIHFSGGIDEALLSLIPHEFFHVFHNHMTPSPALVVGFHAEGMAEVMAYEGTNLQYLQNRGWYFKQGLERFVNENGRDPKLEDIMPDTDMYMSVYSYGQAFWYYMLQNHATYVDIRNFFNEGNDWGVFDASYEEIDNGYIDFLKQLAGFYPTAASGPNPVNNSTDVKFPVTLRWTNGLNTQTLDLYFGTDNPPSTNVLENVSVRNSFTPTQLHYNTTYYWQVVTHNEYGDAQGEIWSFTTKPEGTVVLIAPNGDETLEVGTTATISWNCNYIDQIVIELSIDNGNNWNSIADNVNASVGSYEWIIPNTVSQTCMIRITDKSDTDIFDISDVVFVIAPATGADDVLFQIPNKFELMQNYPNPFNPTTKIVYGVPKESQVSIKIFDVIGQEVAELVNEIKTAGYYEVEFNASNLKSGIYFYRMKTDDFFSIKKLVVIK